MQPGAAAVLLSAGNAAVLLDRAGAVCDASLLPKSGPLDKGMWCVTAAVQLNAQKDIHMQPVQGNLGMESSAAPCMNSTAV
jgi:hypothetical protein